jgi:hypothetical protein
MEWLVSVLTASPANGVSGGLLERALTAKLLTDVRPELSLFETDFLGAAGEELREGSHAHRQ